MWSSPSHVTRVYAASTDSRTTNVRFIQDQLKVLHQSILDQRETILSTLVGNSLTQPEAEVEYSLTLATVRQHYEAIDFNKAIENEYKIAQGKDHSERCVGYGVVVVKPTDHTRFYSILSVVACAIAAGNTFIVECDENAIDRLLPQLFQPLDWEIYGIVHGLDTEPELLSSTGTLIVDQTGKTDAPLSIKSLPNLRSVAVVDRTANVEVAAHQILAAHLAFSGQSPHAPDLIVVNEWVKQQFIDALTHHDMVLSPNSRKKQPKGDAWKANMAGLEAKGEVTILQKGPLTILDIKTKSSPLVEERGRGRYLTLLTASSLADAVLTLSQSEYLVAYHFAEPAAGKFLGQQINSQCSWVNQIPAELLVGPALPSNQPYASPSIRYTTDMLSKPRPALIASKTLGIDLEDLTNAQSSKLQSFAQQETRPLRETGQGSGTSIGFFEQGIIVGGVFIVLPVLSILGYSSWTLTKKVLLPIARDLIGFQNSF